MPQAGGHAMGGTSVRWLWWLGLGFVLLAIVGALVYSRSVGSVVSSSEPAVAGSGVTARQAFAPVAGLAAQWHEDARLAAVSGRWPAVGTQAGEQDEWAFQLFSPSTQRLAVVVVAGGTARLVRESVSPYPVSTFSPEEWRVDSDRALQAWWNRGGRSLVARRPDTDVAMQLRMPDEGSEQPVWTVVGSLAGTETVLIVLVNATSGALVD